MSLSVHQVRSILDQCSAESYGFIDREPPIGTKLSGRFTKLVGGNIVKFIPDSFIDGLESKARNLVWSSEPIKFSDSVYDPQKVPEVLKAGDRAHRKNVLLVFGEGAVGSASISAAILVNPLAGAAAYLAEISASYLTLLKCSYEIQKTHCITPTLELSANAFSVATAPTRAERIGAYHGAQRTMLHNVFARRLNTHKDPTFASHMRQAAIAIVSDMAENMGPAGAVDAAAEQSARAVFQASVRSFCQKHPQIMAAIAPVAGAAVGGSWAVWSARNMLLASYHLSRLEYIETVRLFLERKAVA